MSHIFGPVPSRRLGRSLGIDIVPFKTCSLSCVYCQVGHTETPTLQRKPYVPADIILSELAEIATDGLDADWITFSGSGEPTLNSDIGIIIDGIKQMADIPVCVITNGTLLWDPQVRKDIIRADAIMPSLDAAESTIFQRINRPHENLRIESIIDGLIALRSEYTGKIWLEIMIVEDLNDSQEHINALIEVSERVEPDIIQLNTVARPPAESKAHPISQSRLEDIRDQFGNKAEIIASFKSYADHTNIKQAELETVMAYLKRRPGTTEDISSALEAEKDDIRTKLEILAKEGRIRSRDYNGVRYWEAPEYHRGGE